MHREKDWRRIIGEVRKVYDGKLTYSANWYREFEQITFWMSLISSASRPTFHSRTRNNRLSKN